MSSIQFLLFFRLRMGKCTVLTTLLITLNVLNCLAVTYEYVGNGSWTTQGNWQPSYPGLTIFASDSVIITGQVTSPDNEAIMINGTLSVQGSFAIRHQLTLNGSINIANNKLLNIGGSPFLGLFYSYGTINNIGQIIVNNGAANLHNFGTLNNFGLLTVNGYFDNSNIVSSTGTIWVNQSQVNNGEGIFRNNSTFTNTGQFWIYPNGKFINQAGGNCSFTSTSSLLQNAPSLIELHFSSSINLSGTSTLNGTLTNSGELTVGGTINLSGNLFNNNDFLNQGNLNIYGTFEAISSSISRNTSLITIFSSGIVLNQSNFTNFPGATIQVAGNFTNKENFFNYGNIVINQGNFGIINNSTNASFQGLGSSTITAFFPGQIINSNLATISLSSGSSMTLNNATLKNNGSISNSGSILLNGLYTGSGNYFGQTFTQNSPGTIEPGNSPGCMNFNSNVTLNNIGIFCEINGNQACSDYDKIIVTGDLNLSGNLFVQVNQAPSIGTFYTIISADTIIGAFSQVTLPPDWYITYNPDNIKLTYGVTLPVELLDFHGRYIISDEMIQLVWTTGSESDKPIYQIQKSIDSKQWHQVDTIIGYDTSTHKNYYKWNDKSLLSTNNYYRLKIVENSGLYSFSPIIQVSTDANKKHMLLPNPVSSYFELTSHELINQLLIFDDNGVLVKEFNGNRKTYFVNDLPQGRYWIKLFTDSYSISENFLKI